MAGDLQPEHAGWLTAISGATGAAMGAFGLWIANRTLGKAAVQAALNNMAKDFIDQLQEERETLRRMLAEERVEWAAEREELKGEIHSLKGEIRDLEEALGKWERQLGRPSRRRPGQASPASRPDEGETP